MGLVDDFEKRLERIVEGAFSKAFRSKIHPAEIGRRLLREMEGGKSVSVGAVYVPNVYTVTLSAPDHERFGGLLAELRKEFIGLLRSQAKERRWRPAGTLEVAFAQDPAMREGNFVVGARHEPGENGDAGPEEPVPAVLKVIGALEQEWTLHGDGSTIGRAGTNDIVLSDSNASREHARIARHDDGWWIFDSGSTNGTLVNEALVKERRLRDGDVIRIGTTELQFSEPEAP